jgi:two-component SAPR family response regulator
MAGPLEGVRVLVVEDDFLVSLLFDDMLSADGGTVLGPVSCLADALAAAKSADCDVAVLDINLAGERVDPVATVLAQRNVPFVFVTGYGDGVPGEHSGRPRLGKPFTRDQLRRALRLAIGRRAEG